MVSSRLPMNMSIQSQNTDLFVNLILHNGRSMQNANTMLMIVKNVNGSSRFKKPAGYTCWLSYWEAQTGNILKSDVKYKCPACGKPFPRKNFNGAHVQKASSSFDQGWYIIPICDQCNNSTGNLSVKVTLVPVPSRL